MSLHMRFTLNNPLRKKNIESLLEELGNSLSRYPISDIKVFESLVTMTLHDRHYEDRIVRRVKETISIFI